MPEFHFAIPDDVPEQAQHRNQIETEAARHEFQTMFDEMSPEHLKILQAMMHAIGLGDPNLALWFEGTILGLMKAKYNICMTCLVNHDEEVSQMDTEVKEDSSEKPLVWKPRSPEDFSELDKKVMKEYHLDDQWDEDTMAFMGFACTGIEGARGPCGLVYQSIEDRMLREPESCSGCHKRMGQG